MKAIIQKYSFGLYFALIFLTAIFIKSSGNTKTSSFTLFGFLLTLVYMFILEKITPKSYGKEEVKEQFLSFTTFLLNMFIIGKYLKQFLAAGFIFIYDHYFSAQYDPIGLRNLHLLVAVPLAFLTQDFLRYWAHRFQHTLPLLWKFHRFHHDVPTINTINLYRSHPIDYCFRNVIPPTFVYMLGFSAETIFLSTVLSLAGMFSHCGADLKMGFMNKVLSTNQVHRWHHAKEFTGIGYNFGVTLIIWDIFFKTYYLPEDETGLELGVRR